MMNFTDFNDHNLEKNIQHYSSLTVNSFFTIFVLINLFKPSFKTYSKSRKIRVIKCDSPISVLLIVNGLAAIFSVLTFSLTFCQISTEYFDVILSGLNVVTFLPTFYVVCAFKCRSTRRFVANIVILSIYCFACASFNLYKLSRISSVDNVSFGIVLVSALCSGLLSLLFVSNLGDVVCKKQYTHQVGWSFWLVNAVDVYKKVYTVGI